MAVEPIPYAGYWIMVAEAPASNSRIDCLPIAKAPAAGNGWWHDAMESIRRQRTVAPESKLASSTRDLDLTPISRRST